jgi:hypothetical protein
LVFALFALTTLKLSGREECYLHTTTETPRTLLLVLSLVPP